MTSPGSFWAAKFSIADAMNAEVNKTIGNERKRRIRDVATRREQQVLARHVSIMQTA